MENKIVKKEGYTVELEIALSKEEFNGYITKAYNKDKGKFMIQGFRRGKAPQYLIERVYGKGVFYDTAIDMALNAEYPKTVDNLKLDVVDYPHVDLKDMDEENGVTFIVKVDVKPEVELGEYKGVEIVKSEVEVTAEEVEDALNKEADKNSRMISVEDRPVADKDTVIIDYEGSVNGIPFDGGKAEKHELVIGSKSFIPGFEDQIIGHNLNDEFDVNVKFPDEYHSEELKGKEAVFKVVLHEIKVKELPVVDDEFIKDISEYDTVSQYKEETKKKMLEEKQKRAEDSMRSQALAAACENAKVDVPNAMIDQATDRIIENMKMEMQYSGYTLEQYLEYTGMKIEDVRSQYKEQARMMVVRDLVVEAVKNAENIQVTDEEIEEQLKKEAEMYKMELEQIKKAIGDYKKYYTDKIADDKAVDLIYSSAKKVKELKAKKTVKKEDKEEGEAKKAEPKKKAAPKKSTKKAEEDKADKE
jgi:trigger factor